MLHNIALHLTSDHSTSYLCSTIESWSIGPHQPNAGHTVVK